MSQQHLCMYVFQLIFWPSLNSSFLLFSQARKSSRVCLPRWCWGLGNGNLKRLLPPPPRPHPPQELAEEEELGVASSRSPPPPLPMAIAPPLLPSPRKPSAILSRPRPCLHLLPPLLFLLAACLWTIGSLQVGGASPGTKFEWVWSLNIIPFRYTSSLQVGGVSPGYKVRVGVVLNICS